MTPLFSFSLPGHWEWVIILFIVLLLFGGKKIPELFKGIGKGIREFKDESKSSIKSQENQKPKD
jgi:sec-independent protein translocase protein TatA